MGRGFVYSLVFLLFAGAGLGQQSEDNPRPANESNQGPPRKTNPPVDEISELRATVSQLQERLDQLAPVSDERASTSRWPMNAFWQDGLQIENEIFRVHVG